MLKYYRALAFVLLAYGILYLFIGILMGSCVKYHGIVTILCAVANLYYTVKKAAPLFYLSLLLGLVCVCLFIRASFIEIDFAVPALISLILVFFSVKLKRATGSCDQVGGQRNK